MRSYVLPGINAAQRERLNRNGVPFGNWANGILITGPTNLAEALRVLDATATEVPTNYDDYFEVLLTYNANDGLVGEDEPVENDRGNVNTDLFIVEEPEPTEPTEPTNPQEDPIWDADWRWHERHPKTRRRRRRGNKKTTAISEGTDTNVPLDIRQKSRQNYIDACQVRLEEVRENSRQLVMPAIEKLRFVEARFVAATRMTAVEAEPITEEQMRQRFKADMVQIRALDKVHDIRVVQNGLLIYTDELRITIPETATEAERKIGRFMIWFRLNGKDAGVYWFNSTRRVRGARDMMNAPYVYADGRPSCDEITMTLLELIARCEFAAAVDMAIQYVETFNPENPLSEYADNWPSVKRIVEPEA